ncbi:hypothetical protein HOY82DRAFT_254362 [Tuber indicum]|nr:hypothetical protein HOY82DRAFT_254362 [Tuber indicum]
MVPPNYPTPFSSFLLWYCLALLNQFCIYPRPIGIPYTLLTPYTPFRFVFVFIYIELGSSTPVTYSICLHPHYYITLTPILSYYKRNWCVPTDVDIN